MWRDDDMRETPKALNTTLFWKHNKGTQLIAGSNGKKFKDIWAIRRLSPKSVMIGYGIGLRDYVVIGQQ